MSTIRVKRTSPSWRRMSASDFLPLLVWTPLAQLDAELLVIPAFDGDDFVDVPGLDAATGGDVGRAVSSRESKLNKLRVRSCLT